jgi:N-acetylmuramoyl-L-alanine amidase
MSTKIKICIDPGHGGKDPGAVGSTGLEEAEVALDISVRVANILRTIEVETLMTRSSNVFIELSDRCDIANDWGANYFVSVHLNSNGSTVAGIETLYKSDKGKALAAPMQEAMIAATGDKDRGIKYRDDLYVLNGTKMPAVMVEVGFISNPAFEEKFKGNEYRDVLANAIVVGLIEGLSMPAPADRRVSKK